MEPERRDVIINPRAHKWQWLAVFSGLLLTASFFMPVMSMGLPSNRVSPCWVLHRSFDSLIHFRGCPLLVKLFYLNGDLQRLGSVYALGGLLALGVLGRLRRVRSLTAVSSSLLLAFLFSYCLLSPLVILTGYLHPDYVPRLDLPGFLRNPLASATLRESILAPAVALVYVLFSFRHGRRGHLCRAFLASLWAFIFFTWILVHRFPVSGQFYGRYVAPVAAALLLLATIGEMAAATGQSWPQTVVQSLLCRPAPAMDMKGRCPGCSYQLYGLRDLRCPECGRTFTLEEIHLKASDSPAPPEAPA